MTPVIKDQRVPWETEDLLVQLDQVEHQDRMASLVNRVRLDLQVISEVISPTPDGDTVSSLLHLGLFSSTVYVVVSVFCIETYHMLVHSCRT